MLKRLLSVLLAVSMLAAIIPSGAAFADGAESESV